MESSEVIALVKNQFEEVSVQLAYSETTFFYNPNLKLPKGVYFLTIKEKDGPKDKLSRLNRDGIFRVSFKPYPETYKIFFGQRPKRSRKDESNLVQLDHGELNTWMPHSVYAWMGWTMILNPKRETLEDLWPYITEAYEQAKKKLEDRIKSN